MESNDTPWKRKMVVRNIPEDWSRDMLENFMEVVTRAELEQDGVEHFCGVKHTVLLTFTEILTDQHVRQAQTESAKKGKTLQFTLIQTAPSAIIVEDLSPSLTHDNLFYYFESPRSGGEEGSVEKCDLNQEHRVAVVTFSNIEVMASVLAVPEHFPRKGHSIHIAPCYDQFHEVVLRDLNHPPKTPPNAASFEDTHFSGQPKPALLPKPQVAVAPRPQIPSSVPRTGFSGLHGDSAQCSPLHSTDFGAGSRTAQSVSGQNQAWGWHEGYGDKAANLRGGGRSRGKRNRKGRNRGRYPSHEEISTPGRLDDQNSNRGRGWGRRPYSNHWQARGRGQGKGRGFISPSQDVEAISFGSGHASTPTLSAACRPVMLDAECHPLPPDEDWDDKDTSESSLPQHESSGIGFDHAECTEISVDDIGFSIKETRSHAQHTKHPDTPQFPKGHRTPALKSTKQDTLEPSQSPKVKESVHQLQPTPREIQPLLGASAPGGLKASETPFCPVAPKWAEKRGPPQPPLAQLQPQGLQVEQETERLRKEKLELEERQKKVEEQELQLRKKEEERKRMEDQQSLEAKRTADKERIKYLELEKKLKQMELENDELKKRKKKTVSVPGYKMKLLTEFIDNCKICEIVVHKKEETVEFHGGEEEITVAQLGLLNAVQDLCEESLSIDLPVAAILRTDPGQMYLTQLCEKYSICSYDIQDTSVLCASPSKRAMRGFLTELGGNILQETLKVPSTNVLVQIHPMKLQLEEDSKLVRITISADSSNIHLVGIKEDVCFAKRKLEEVCSTYKSGQGNFQITEALKVKACKQWCSQELENVKALILQNNGNVNVSETPCFTLVYQCPKDVIPQVQQKLDSILKVIKVTRVKLDDEFKRYSERALVVNGMHHLGVEPFCGLLEKKLKKDGGWDCVLDISLPPKFKLPELKYSTPAQSLPRSSRPPPPKPRPAQPPRPRQSGHQHHRHDKSIRPYAPKIGGSTLIVKSGDIASENVDALVCVVGEDMDMKQTAVGQAILKKFPQCDRGQQKGAAGQVVTRDLQQTHPQLRLLGLQGANARLGGQGCSSVYLAALTKWPPLHLQANLKTVVQRCLQKAVQQGYKTLAFPPLGEGRRFGFPLDQVAVAMVTTVQQFLQHNQGMLQSVTIVLYDKGIARQFREKARQIIDPPWPAFLADPQPAAGSSSDSDDDGDSGSDDDGGVLMDPFTSPHGFGDFFTRPIVDDDDDNDEDGNDDSDDIGLSFFNLDEDEDAVDRDTAMPAAAAVAQSPVKTAAKTANGFVAQVCVQNLQHLQAVKTHMLRELRTTFIHEDKITDMKTFRKLGRSAMEEIKTAALKRDVVLSAGGKETLLLRGQRAGVAEMVTLIKDKIYAHQQKSEGRSHRHPRGGHSMDQIRLPGYWKICQDGLFKSLEQWVRDRTKYGKLHSVSTQEQTEIDSLIRKTWDQRFVGAGNDAVGLKHKGVQITKVERLENPNLWEEYCVLRNRLFRRMKEEQRGTPFTCLEKVKGSSGPLRTTSNLSRGSVLQRDICPEINEHYLFHGTKKDYIQAIHDQGLDTRIASPNAMLGRGVYASESATKADQYTDDKQNRTSGKKTMILMRVLMGEPFINKQRNPTKYSRPPCKRCYKDRCQCSGGGFFDSVIDDAGRNFREFVFYDRAMCYPEYFITYLRV